MEILNICLNKEIDYGVISESLTHFHLLHHSAWSYVNNQADKSVTDFYRKLLISMWKMAAQAEQMAFYVQTERIEPDKRERIDVDEPYIGHLMEQYQEELERIEELCEGNRIRYSCE